MTSADLSLRDIRICAAMIDDLRQRTHFQVPVNARCAHDFPSAFGALKEFAQIAVGAIVEHKPAALDVVMGFACVVGHGFPLVLEVARFL
jgi:hypothetical protein